MKKKTRFLFSFIIALAAIFSLGIFNPKSTTSADAAGEKITIIYDIQYIDATYIDGATEVQIDINTSLDKFLYIALDEQALVGWATLENPDVPIPLSTVFEHDTTLRPILANKTYNYTITQTGSGITATASTDYSGFSYTVTGNNTSLSNVITLINDDHPNVSNTTPSCLNFNNFTLNEGETIVVSDPSVITGNFVSNSALPVFTIRPENTNYDIVFENVNITANNTTTLISAENRFTYTTPLTLRDCSLNSTSATNALLLGSKTILTLEGNVAHSTEYLYEHISGLTLNLNNSPLNVNNPIKIALGIADGSTGSDFYAATNIYPGDTENLLFVATNDAFKYIFSTFGTAYGYNLIASTALNLNLIPNGGNYKAGYTLPTYNYWATAQKPLPTALNIEKASTTFGGWFGKLTITETEQTTYLLPTNTYYFDTVALNSFLTNGADISQIATYFKTSLQDFDIANAFTNYAYASEASASNAWAELFVSRQQAPELIAKWNNLTYTITFDSNGGSPVEPLSVTFEELITLPTSPTKTGYTFDCWCTDSATQTPFTSTHMEGRNFTLYAKWNPILYTVTFIPNNGQETITTTQAYNAEISLPTTLSKQGHDFVGWFTDATFENAFTLVTVPLNGITLYAKWEAKLYNVLVVLGGKGTNYSIPVQYGTTLAQPQTPQSIGYVFNGWFADQEFNTPFNFESPIVANNTTIYANWIVNTYTLTLIKNNSTGNETFVYDYNAKINTPNQPTKKGYAFTGWYIDANCTTQFNFETLMPNSDLTLYAGWNAKTVISLELAKQTQNAKNQNGYSVPTNITGFVIEYKVSGAWTTTAPTKIGTYDVRVFRAEDNNYAEFNQIIEDGFEVKQSVLKLTWLAVACYALFLFEIIMIIIVKILRKKKRTQTIIVPSIVLPFGIIDKTEFVLVAVSIVLALFGFIYLVVELVKLHRTVPLPPEKDTKYDNRALIEKRGDKSQDASISSNVNNLLKSEGFYVKDFSKDDNYKIEENIIERADDIYTGKASTDIDIDDDDYSN